MKTFCSFIAFILIACSCKKENDSPDPVYVAKPDTLSVNWKKVIVNSSQNFGDIIFTSTSTGYLTGSKTYKSIDGGVKWDLISNMSPVSLAMTADGKVFFTGAKGFIYRSDDAGNTIIPFSVSGTGIDIFFIDNLNGFCNTSLGLYYSINGGLSWDRLNTMGIHFSDSYGSLFFTDKNTGWMATAHGVYKSNGSLLNWLPVTIASTATSNNFQSVFVTPDNTVYIGNLFGELFKSADGGNSFQQIKTSISGSSGFTDIHFVDNNTGFFSTGNRIYKTIDGGITWSVVVATGESQLIEIHFLDANHGWACGTKGTVLIFKNI